MEGLDPEGMAPENALILHTPVVWDSGFLVTVRVFGQRMAVGADRTRHRRFQTHRCRP